jgi:hypothetical protein
VQLFEDIVAESRADMADIAPAVAFAQRESKRPETGPGPSWGGEAGDDDFLPFRYFDLQPVIRARA